MTLAKFTHVVHTLTEKVLVGNIAKSDKGTLSDHGFNSLDNVELGFEIEKQFKIDIPDELIERFGNMTISDIAKEVLPLIGNNEATS